MGAWAVVAQWVQLAFGCLLAWVSPRFPAGSECSLGGGNVTASRVWLDRHPDRPCQALEDRLADMVCVPSVVEKYVEVHPSLGAHRLPEVGDKLTVECADLGRGHGRMPGPEWAAAKVNRGGYQSFVHGQDRVAVSSDPRAIAKCTVDRLAQADTNILGRVMIVDLQV